MTTSFPTATLLIPSDIGRGWRPDQFSELSAELEHRLNQPVVVCSSNDEATPLTTAIQELVTSGHQRLVLLPVGVVPLSTNREITLTLSLAKRQWPQLSIHMASPLTWLECGGWLRATGIDAANEAGLSPEESAVLLVGESVSNPLVNADLARLSHLVLEGGSLASVGYSFVGSGRPDIPEAVVTLTAADIKNVIVVPWLITRRESIRRIASEIEYVERVDGLNMKLALPTLTHSAIVNLLVSNHYVALAEEADWFDSDVDSDPNDGRPVGPPERAISAQEAFELRQLESRINAMLPSEYQGAYESVKPQSMGTASLKFDDAGKVAWGDIWTSFCDLALAGGPPHRGTLLEAVSSSDALAEPEQYQAVVDEIERGIKLVTSLPVVTSKTPGWVGVRCASEEMAVWLMRAIIVENIMVRREGDVLYLPAGPRFTVKREIKNVITAIAKTVHYWSTHLLARRQAEERRF